MPKNNNICILCYELLFGRQTSNASPMYHFLISIFPPSQKIDWDGFCCIFCFVVVNLYCTRLRFVEIQLGLARNGKELIFFFVFGRNCFSFRLKCERSKYPLCLLVALSRDLKQMSGHREKERERLRERLRERKRKRERGTERERGWGKEEERGWLEWVEKQANVR